MAHWRGPRIETVFIKAIRVVELSRLHFMGYSGCDSKLGERGSAARTARWTPRSHPDEISGENVCLVARHWHRYWDVCPAVPPIQQVQLKPQVAPLCPWRPWARLHLDFTGPFLGKMFLILIDTHSKWIEAVCTTSTASSVVIKELRTVFTRLDYQRPLSLTRLRVHESKIWNIPQTKQNQAPCLCPISPVL